MSGLNPIDHEDAYDVLLIDGTASPGIVKISGHSRTIKWDIQSADGSGGASTTFKGEEIAKFTATWTLVKDDTLGVDEFEAWREFQTILDRSWLAKPVQALVCYHPDLIDLNIVTVSIEDISGVVHNGDGSATVAVKFLEFRPPKPKASKPKAKAAKNDPNADVKKTLNDTIDEAQKPF